MPRESNIKLLLPDAVQRELNIKLAKRDFDSYQGLSEWLKEQGFEISKSSVHRYGQSFQSKLEAIKATIEKAKAIVESVGDDENDLAEGLTRLTQHRAAELLLAVGDEIINADGESSKFSITPGELSNIGKMVAALNNSSIAVKKFRSDTKVKVGEIIDRAKDEPMTVDVLTKIREEIYGLIDRQ